MAPAESPQPKAQASKDGQVIVTVTPNKMQAFIQLVPHVGDGKPVTIMDVVSAITKEKIQVGINKEVLAGLSRELVFNQRILVAEGIPPAPGIDSGVEYHFPLSKDAAPKVMPDGSVDFKDLGIINNVREGDLLCTKIPAKRGKYGVDVYGNRVEGNLGRDLALPVGKGVSLSEDAMHVYAAVTGQVDLMNGRINVLNNYVVNRNVGNATGNIDFLGNVTVRGDIMNGFMVKAEGNVTVGGSLDGGTIICGGNVSITDGIARSVVKADGNLRCKYIQSSDVIVNGKIETSSIIASTVRSGDVISVLGSHSAIIGSIVSARSTIDCTNAGGKGSTSPTVLEVGTDTGATVRYGQIPTEMINLKKRIEVHFKELALLDNLLKVGKILPPTRDAKCDEIKEKIRLLNNQLQELEEEKQLLEEEIKKNGYGSININGIIVPGTTIIIGPERKILREEVSYLRFARRPDQGLVVTVSKT